MVLGCFWTSGRQKLLVFTGFCERNAWKTLVFAGFSRIFSCDFITFLNQLTGLACWQNVTPHAHALQQRLRLCASIRIPFLDPFTLAASPVREACQYNVHSSKERQYLKMCRPQNQEVSHPCSNLATLLQCWMFFVGDVAMASNVEATKLRHFAQPTSLWEFFIFLRRCLASGNSISSARQLRNQTSGCGWNLMKS